MRDADCNGEIVAEESAMLSRAEAARYLGTSVRTLDRYAESKRLPCHYEEGKTRPRKVFDESDLNAFKAERAAERARLLPDRRTPEAMGRVGFRLDPDDLRLLEQQATLRGESPGSYARHLVIVGLHEQSPLLETNAAIADLSQTLALMQDDLRRSRQRAAGASALTDLQRGVEGLRADFANVGPSVAMERKVRFGHRP